MDQLCARTVLTLANKEKNIPALYWCCAGIKLYYVAIDWDNAVVGCGSHPSSLSVSLRASSVKSV